MPTPAHLILDVLEGPDHKLVRPLQCIIVGTSKRVTEEAQRTHYALIVSYIRNEGEDRIYERARVAFLTTDELLPPQDERYIRIQ